MGATAIKVRNSIKPGEETNLVKSYRSLSSIYDELPFSRSKIGMIIKLIVIIISVDMMLVEYAYGSVPPGSDISRHMAVQYNAFIDLPGMCLESFLLGMQHVFQLFGTQINISGLTTSFDWGLKTFFEMESKKLGSGWFSPEVYEPIGIGYITRITMVVDAITRRINNSLIDWVNVLLDTMSWKESMYRVIKPVFDIITIRYVSIVIRMIPMTLYLLYSLCRTK